MATLNAIGQTIDISMNFSSQINHNAQGAPVDSSRYTWTTSSGNTITAFSFADDITFSATAPTGGTVHAIQVSSSYTVGGVTGNLVSMALGTLDDYWLPILNGDTTIFASAHAGFDGSGDFLNILTGQNRTGAADLFEGAATASGDFQTFFGDAGFVGGNATLTGGADEINMREDGSVTGDVSGVAGRLNGGNDVISVDGVNAVQSSVSGDAIFNTDNEQGFTPTVNGGNDLLDINGYTQTSGGGIAGDLLFHNVGTTTGGHDTIDGSGNPVFFQAYGDVRFMSDGTVRGGNDRLTASDTESCELSGDVDNIFGGTLQAGADRLFGGGGGDSLFGEFIDMGGGTVITSGSFNGQDTIAGLGGDDVIRGQIGNDRLDGGFGDDIIDGGANTGNGDTAAFDGLAVAVSADLNLGFAFGQGDDSLVDLENLIGSSKGDRLGGNGGNNRLEGLAGNDEIFGRANNDQIFGGDSGDLLRGGNGNDSLSGDGGNDELHGGSGVDTQNGGQGLDTFDYNSTGESGTTAATRDIINGFSQGGASADVFDLDSIDAMAGTAGNNDFTFIGNAAFSAEGQIRATTGGGMTIIEVNTTGNSGAEMTMQINGVFTLQSTDFA